MRLLQEALTRVGEPPVVSKEPTGGQWGSIIRGSATTGRLSVEDELELFIKDRTEHVEKLIGPALADGRIVILDRYFYSSIAYQGSRGANVDEVKEIMESRFPIPDAVFILDVEPVLGIHRIANSRNEEPNHFEDRKNLAKAREIFKSLSETHIHHIDGSATREQVHSELIARFIDGALKVKRCSRQYGCDDPFHCVSRIVGSCQWFRMQRELRDSSITA